MNKHSIVNHKCPCFLFRYPNLDIPSQALFNLHRASALPLWCGIEDDQHFQSPPGHSRRPVRRRRYTMVLVCQGVRWLWSNRVLTCFSAWSLDWLCWQDDRWAVRADYHHCHELELDYNGRVFLLVNDGNKCLISKQRYFLYQVNIFLQ